MQNDSSYINITKNILRRRLMVLIGLIFICCFNALFLFVTYVLKGGEIALFIIDAVMVTLLVVYMVFYAVYGRSQMYKSIYRVGRIINLLPVLFYTVLTISFAIGFHLVNYEYIAYAVFSLALELFVFRFNLKDKNPLKLNNFSIISGAVAMGIVPVLIVTAFFSGLDISVLDFSRTVKYELNDDDTLTITGVYSGLSSKVTIENEYYTQKVRRVGAGAFDSGLSEIYISDGIEEIEEGAFNGVHDVYLYGAPHLQKGAVSGVDVLHLLNTDEMITAEEGFFEGSYIEVDRSLIDSYRNRENISSMKVQPSVSKDEVFINFDTDVYVKTVILKKGEILNDEVLLDSDDVDEFYYNATKDYDASNAYYQSCYQNGLDVIPRWVNEENDELFAFGVAVNESAYITPVVEQVYKYTVYNRLGDVNDKTYYVSNSYSQDLPTLEDFGRTGFNKLTYTLGGEEITRLEALDLDDYTVTATWTMEDPDIVSLDNAQNFTVDRVYDANTTTVLTPNSNHPLNVSYTYYWTEGNLASSETNPSLEAPSMSFKNVSTSGTYTLTCKATFSEFGVTYTSESKREFYVTITKATPTIIASNVDEVYSGTVHGITDAEITVGEDTPILVTYTGTSEDGESYASDSMPVKAGSYTANISIAETANYKSLSINKDVKIEKRPVEVTLYEDLTSVYNGDSWDTIDARYKNDQVKAIEEASGNSGLVSGDTLGFVLTGITRNNNRYEAGSYPLSLTISNANYVMTLTNPAAVYTITKKPAVITAKASSSVYGEKITPETETSGILDSDSSLITLGLYTAESDTDNSQWIDAVKENGSYGYVDAGSYYVGYKADSVFATNYSVTFTSASYQVSKRIISVTPSTSSLTYTSKEQTFGVALDNAADKHSITSVATVSGNKATNAGDYAFTVSLQSGYQSNYDIASYDGSYSIAKYAASVKASASSNTYGDALKLSYAQNGLFTSDANGLSLHIYKDETMEEEVTEASLNGYGYVPVGSYYIGYVATDEVKNNYDITYTSASYTVSKKTLSVALATGSLTYNGTTQTKAKTVSNLNSSHSLSDVFTITGTDGTNAGSYTMSFAFNDNYGLNYTLTTTDYSWTISKKALTVTAKGGTITYGGTFTNSVTYSGFAASEGVSVLTGDVSYDVTYNQYDKAGSYVITPSGLSSDNYEITFKSGTLNVSKKTVTVTAGSGTITYGETFDNSVSYSGFVNGDTASSLSLSPSYSVTYNQYDKAGSYTIRPSGLTSDNYSYSYVAGTLTVSKASLTITISADDVIYGTTPSPTWTGSGYLGTDSDASISGTASYIYKNNNNVSVTGTLPVGTYTVSVSGLSSDNYEMSYVTDTMSVSKKALTITYKNQSVVYGKTPSKVLIYQGLADGESSSSLGGTLSVSFTGSTNGDLTTILPVGSYTAMPSGLTSSNYEISYASGILTVTKASLTVTANAVKVAYGESYTPSVSFKGLVNGDSFTDVTYTYKSGTTVIESPKNVGTYSIVPSGITTDSYTITYVSGSLTISAKQATGTLSNATVEEGNSLSLQGLMNLSGVDTADVSSFHVAVNGDASCDVSTLSYGTYTLTIITTDSNYVAPSCTATLTVMHIIYE